MVRPFGIKNIGSSCYANAVVQALISCRSIDFNFLNIEQLIKEFGFIGQQDAMEFMLAFIDKYKIDSLFESKWNIGLYCRKCSTIVTKFTDSMIVIGVEKKICVFNNVKNIANYLIMNLTSLTDYKCPKCGCSKFCKVSKISHLPKILAIYFLKYNGKWNPHQYDSVMNLYGHKYELRSVVHHSGNNGGGHYTCSAVRDDGTYLFDDEKFVKMSMVCGENDYILFYELKTKI